MLSVLVKRYNPSDPCHIKNIINFANHHLQVCYVDYGDVEWILEREIRQIREEYMSLPFQAVHCRLADVSVRKEFKSQPKMAL